MDGDSEKPPHEILSDREYQVMLMIASGKPVGTIAKELCLSVKTSSSSRAKKQTNRDSRFGQKPMLKAGGQDYRVGNTTNTAGELHVSLIPGGAVSSVNFNPMCTLPQQFF